MRRPPGKVLSFAYDTKCDLNYISQKSLVPHLANTLSPLTATCGSTRSFCQWIWKKWLCPTWSPTVPRCDLCLPGRAGPGTSLEVMEDHKFWLCTKVKRLSSWTEIFWLMLNPDVLIGSAVSSVSAGRWRRFCIDTNIRAVFEMCDSPYSFPVYSFFLRF